MLRESLLYERLPRGYLRCLICQRRCSIAPGKRGWCLTRENRRGRLVSLIYGEVSSLSMNPIEKKPVFHFLPGSVWLSVGSVGCNFRCPGCQNWQIAHYKGGPMGTTYVGPGELLQMALREGAQGISWTFNEPTLWFQYTLEGARLAKEQGLFTNYVTNGFISPEALRMLSPWLDVFRVDIKGFFEETYRKIAHTRAAQGVRSSTELARNLGVHVECVTNIVPGVNDSVEELRAIARWIKDALGVQTPWHISRFYPHCEWSHLEPTPVETLEQAWHLGREAGLWYVYLGNVPGHKWENTYCHSCGGLLIRRYVFQVLQNRIRNGRCSHCGSPVPGRWQ
jgi:pyruvate formate lyase activating enzyme